MTSCFPLGKEKKGLPLLLPGPEWAAAGMASKRREAAGMNEERICFPRVNDYSWKALLRLRIWKQPPGAAAAVRPEGLAPAQQQATCLPLLYRRYRL